jgi:S-formylglutathione hydrolase FrmB
VRGAARAFAAALLAPAILAAATAAPAAPPAAAQGAHAARAQGPRMHGAIRDTTFWSQALGTRKRYVVYLPPSYGADAQRRFPVLYYLHGMWGSEDDWTRAGRLELVMDSLVRAGAPEAIVVMPDGDDGWYTTWNFLGDYAGCRRAPRREKADVDTYCVPWPKYDDYIARDLVAHVDSAWRTLARRERRGIAGLSMGGYGAVTLALRYPEVFAAAASHSGVLAPMYGGPSPFAPPPRWATSVDTLRARLGEALWPFMLDAFGDDTAGWAAREPARLARRLVRRGGPVPALFFDVGTADRHLDRNRAFDHELRTLGVAHEYHEWPGGHTWDYWRAHVGESLAWLLGLVAPGGAP